MNLKPKISVVMPFYNCEKFLDEAVQSILNQTFTDFEFIIINDASTDASDRVMQKYLDDPRIIYVKNKTNLGIVRNLNKGLALSRSGLIARMDGDDVAEPNRLELQYTYLLEHPDITVVGSFVKIIDERSNQVDLRTKPCNVVDVKRDILLYSPVIHPSVVFRKRDVLSAGGYRQKFLYSEDIDLWYRLVFSGYNITNIPNFLLRYRYHANSTAHRSRENALRAYRLRMETVRNFQLSLTFKQKLLVYLQFIVGYLFTGRQRQFIEGFYKRIFYGSK